MHGEKGGREAAGAFRTGVEGREGGGDISEVRAKCGIRDEWAREGFRDFKGSRGDECGKMTGRSN